jgi:hypothetical protein
MPAARGVPADVLWLDDGKQVIRVPAIAERVEVGHRPQRKWLLQRWRTKSRRGRVNEERRS